MLRALSLVDVLSQLQQDSGTDIPFDANEVINQFGAMEETLVLGSESLTAATVTNYPVNIIQDVGPVGYWRMDDAPASTVAYDSNPWGNTTTYPKLPATAHGTVTFGATGAMTGSTSAAFDGSSGYVEATGTGSLARVGDLTLECWFNTTSLASTQTLVSKGASTGEYDLHINTNGSVTYRDSVTSPVFVVPASSVTTGRWYHIALVRTAAGNVLAAYLNGSSTFTGSYATPGTSTNPVRWGARSDGAAASFFSGSLDECCIYARPLSAAQVARHYAWGTAPDVGSTAWGTARWGQWQYPTPGIASGTAWGAGVWGTFRWS